MNIFILSHPEDAEIAQTLFVHLQVLRAGGKVENVLAGVPAGTSLPEGIFELANISDLIIIIISASFLADNTLLDIAHRYITKAFFVYGSSCDYSTIGWLLRRKIHPNGLYSIRNKAAWPDPEEPYNMIVKYIRRYYCAPNEKDGLHLFLLTEIIGSDCHFNIWP